MKPIGGMGSGTGPFSQLNQAIQQGASGKKLNSAADNAAGIAMAINMVGGIESQNQARSNIGDALSVLNTAEGGAAGISDSLIRMRELSVQAGNSTLSASQRGMIQAEMDQLSSTISNLSTSTEFNGQTLLDGSTPGMTFQIGPNNTAADQMSVNFQDLGSNALGVDALSMLTEASAGSSIDAVDAALDQVSTFRAELGGSMNQLSQAASTLEAATENQQDSLSRIQDADLGVVSANVAKNSVLLQARVAMQAQGNASQVMALQLLG